MLQKNWTGSQVEEFEKSISIELLAEKAGMSKRNFQIYFKAYTNETTGKFIKRVRLEYALLLLKDKKYTPAEIAERIGFSHDTAFFNSFKKMYNSTPTKLSENLIEELLPDNKENINHKIVKLPEIPILFLSYIGNYDKFSMLPFEENSWDRLYRYALLKDLLPEQEEYWGICFDDTDITDSNKCRFYACMTIKSPVKSKLTDDIKCMIIPADQFASYIHKGSYNDLDKFYNIVLQNIPDEYNLGEGLILERYLNSPNDTPESELLTEILLPVTKI